MKVCQGPGPFCICMISHLRMKQKHEGSFNRAVGQTQQMTSMHVAKFAAASMQKSGKLPDYRKT